MDNYLEVIVVVGGGKVVDLGKVLVYKMVLLVIILFILVVICVLCMLLSVMYWEDGVMEWYDVFL